MCLKELTHARLENTSTGRRVFTGGLKTILTPSGGQNWTKAEANKGGESRADDEGMATQPALGFDNDRLTNNYELQFVIISKRIHVMLFTLWTTGYGSFERTPIIKNI